jgi:DNA-binding NarL/FixJ family response regulator
MSVDQFASLSPRQMDVLRLVAKGLKDAEIAAELGIGVYTVKTHVGRVLVKLDCANRAQASFLLGYRLGKRA